MFEMYSRHNSGSELLALTGVAQVAPPCVVLFGSTNVTTEHVKCDYSTLRCAMSIKHTSDLKIVIVHHNVYIDDTLKLYF